MCSLYIECVLLKTALANTRSQVVLEHVEPEFGLYYLSTTLARGGISDSLLQRVLANDETGDPRRCFYGAIRRLASPTTLRYLKFASDMRILFGTLDGLHVVEVGGGYGGLSKVLFDVFPHIAGYAVFDLPEVLPLIEKHHASMPTLDDARAQGRCCQYLDGSDNSKFASAPPADLFVSYYALTELSDEHAASYLADVAMRCVCARPFCISLWGPDFLKSELLQKTEVP
jgi:putative sugar O-methyltransferase